MPDVAGPTHEYLGALPGCWETYCRVLARDYSERYDLAAHRFCVNAYAVQHPGHPERRTIQSVAVHLIRLWTIFERGTPPERAAGAIRHALTRAERYHWLEPPATMGPVTVRDLADVRDVAWYKDRARAWGEGAWEAWAAHHETIRRWGEGRE